VAANNPYMVAVGNRDELKLITERFSFSDMPLYPTEQGKMFYSFEYNTIHFSFISIQDDYKAESEQFLWLEQDLRTAFEKVQSEESPIQW
jgi:hypothetical protein